MKTVSTTHTFFSLTVATVVAAGLLVGAGLAPAHASLKEDRKNYSGAMCRPVTSPVARVSYERNGSIANRNEQTGVTVLCPIIRDSFRKGGLDGVTATFGGPHEPGSFSCAIRIHRSLDNKVQKIKQKSGIRNGYGTMIVHVSGQRIVNVDAFYMLSCRLPAKRKGHRPPMLHSYHVEERVED